MKSSVISPPRTVICVFLAASVLAAAEQSAPTMTLYQAASQGDIEQLNLHIARGTDLDKPDSNSMTALARAIQSNKTDAVKRLVEAGANPNTPSRESPPIVLATIRRQRDIVEFLLANGADPNAKDRAQRTALITAAEVGDKELVELLVAKGADVNARDQQGQTPLSLANRSRQQEIADFLRERGAQEPVNTYALDPYGRPGMQPGTGTPAGATAAQTAGSYRSSSREPSVLEDPNAIRAKLATFPGLAQVLETLDATGAAEERSWAQRRLDNRTALIRSVAKQFADELAALKTVAVEEKAERTVTAIDELLARRQKRYEVIAGDLREERRAAQQEARQLTGRGRGRTATRSTRGRTTRDSAAQGYGDPGAMNANGPYGARPARGRAPEAQAVEEPPLDAETQSQLQAWLSANPEDKRGLLTTAHQLDLVELDVLRQTAVEEKASKTTAAIEGLMLARQDRVARITTKMAADDERLQRNADRYGAPIGATRARRGRGMTPPQENQTAPRRGRRIR